MDISSRAEFAADPEAVHAMMIDEAYLTEVCRASQATHWSVLVDGDTTRTERTLPAPSAAARFTGPNLNVVEQIVWQPPAADGSRVGELQITIPGQPVMMKGTITTVGAGGSTVATLDGDLKINIPLLGRKLEEAAAPAMIAGFRTHQGVGERWIAERG